MDTRNLLIQTAFFSAMVAFIYGQDVEYYCGNKPADVVFLLDASNSIWGPDFRRQVNFVRDVVDMFQISKNTTRVAVSTFSTRVHREFHLLEYDNKVDLLDAISRTRQRRGYQTNTADAIKFMRRKMFSKVNGGRSNIAQVGIILTDGQSDNMLMTMWQASIARLNHINIFSIGIGASTNQRELNGIASRPASEYLFKVNSYSALDSIKKVLAIRTCRVTTKKPTTTTTPTTTKKPTTTTTTTTTTPRPTTTTPIITTTSVLDVAERECRGKYADIVFAFDSSYNVAKKDFLRQKDFANAIIDTLDISQNKTRIGSIIYSDQVMRIFDLDEHSNKQDIKRDISRIRMTAGGSRIDEAIRYIRTKSFRRSVSRRHTAQIGIIVTASPSSYVHRSKHQATQARRAGLELITIGVGTLVDQEELLAIAGSGETKHMVRVGSFDDLVNIAGEIAIESCRIPEPAVPIADQPCGFRQMADIMFILDSVNAGRTNSKKALTFLKAMVEELDVAKDRIQIGLMSAECQDHENGFTLSAHQTKDSVMNALSRVSETNFHTLITEMRRGAFSPDQGGRKEAKKVAILIVDGDLDDPLKSLTEAQRARIKGVEVFVVQVGQGEPQKELRMMCDSPTNQHFYQINSYDQLKDLKERLIEVLCEEL